MKIGDCVLVPGAGTGFINDIRECYCARRCGRPKFYVTIDGHEQEETIIRHEIDLVSIEHIGVNSK